MGLKNFGKGLVIRKLLEETPMIGKLLKWLTDPTAIGRKRAIAAIAGIIGAALRGASGAIHKACDAADIVGAVCSFNADGAAGVLDMAAQWLNTVVTPGADAVTVLMGLWGLWAARKKKALVVASMVVLAMILPGSAIAQELASSPEPNTVTLSTGSTRFHVHGAGDKTELEGQLLVEVHAPAKTILGSLARFTRTQGSTDAVAGLLDPRTFRSVVAEVSLRRQLAANLDAICSAQVSWDRDKEFDPADPNVWQTGCGLRFWLKGKGSLSIQGPHSGPVGGLGVFGTLLVHQSPSVRYVATYAVPFDSARFRVNPFVFTSGVQIDAKRWKF